MSRMMLRSNGKPPLARSPIRLRPRRKALQPTNTNTVLTPPGSMAKSQLPHYNQAVENSNLQPEYHTISNELWALAKMVRQELGPGGDTSMVDVCSVQRSPTFERGRFYDEYSARRNERLKRKKCSETDYEKKPSYDLGGRGVEYAKKRVESANKLDGRRKVMTVVAAATPVAERREARTPRYSLRSSAAAKENKKPPMPVAMVPMVNGERSVGVSDRKMVRRVTSRKV